MLKNFVKRQFNLFSSFKGKTSFIREFSTLDEKITDNIDKEKVTVKQIKRKAPQRNKEEKYTEEEMDNIHKQDTAIKIMEISDKNYKKLIKYKRFALYLNLPLAIIIPIVNELYLAGLAETSSKMNLYYHLMFVIDVMCFGGAVGGIHGLRNVVIIANYLTKEKKIEFTKLNFQCKPYKIVHDPANLKRVIRNALTPFFIFAT